jgi:subtilisin family serine protease
VPPLTASGKWIRETRHKQIILILFLKKSIDILKWTGKVTPQDGRLFFVLYVRSILCSATQLVVVQGRDRWSIHLIIPAVQAFRQPDFTFPRLPMNLLDLINLTPLMDVTRGDAQIKIALIDGPVAMDHPDLASENVRVLPGKLSGACSLVSSTACQHGTFVAGILCAKRNSTVPAICPSCTLLVRPIFSESASSGGEMPSATPQELAAAILDCIESGARIINLSAALAQPLAKGEKELERALDYSAQRGVIVVAAAGNQGSIGSSAITRHPWVIPVAACNLDGRPLGQSNLGNSIGRRGLSAPGENITSLSSNGGTVMSGGTSVAAPFVTGAIALLWSEFPEATAGRIKLATFGQVASRRASIVPPLLDAWTAYQILLKNLGKTVTV